MQRQMQQMDTNTPVMQNKVLTTTRPRSLSSMSGASVGSDNTEFEVDLAVREEDFLVTVSRLMESSATLNTCLHNLTQALARESSKLPKVMMEFKVASNAKEIMNIS